MKLMRVLALTALTLGPLQAQTPNAKAILEGARLSASLTELKDGLTGELRNRRGKTPVVLYLMGEDIQFQFSEKQGSWRGFAMRFKDDKADLYEVKDGKTVVFPASKLVESIAGTDLTYEDLALRFFYWPDPVLEGEEDVGGQACYKIRVDKPKGAAGRYEVAYVWVHKKFGAFMRIRGHDKSGGLIKEFQVEDVMQVANNVWTLRKMQVATHDPANGRRISLTDVSFDSPKKTSIGPRGLR
jgi:hypothetical protein